MLYIKINKQELNFYPNNIVIDEISLCGINTIKNLYKCFKNTRFFILGDVL